MGNCKRCYNSAIATLNQKAERYATSSPYALDGRCVGSVPTVGIDGKFNAKNTEVKDDRENTAKSDGDIDL